MILTYKYRLKGKRTARVLKRHAWAVNQVWNYCVATQKETQKRWKTSGNGRWLTQFDLNSLTNGVSKDLGISAQTVQCIGQQFAKSRDQHCKCPKFRKSSGSKRSLGWVPFKQQSRQITVDSINYLKQPFRFFGTKRRPLPAHAKGGAFVEDSQGRWWVTFHVEVVVTVTESIMPVGIDLGLKTLATLSNGEKIENPKTFQKWEEKLATAQRAGNRKCVRKIHQKIKNIRADHHHKATAHLVKTYGLIAVGNINASALMKTKMSKSVTDAAWSTFRNFLRYKASRHGVQFLEVSEKFSTQRCSSCQAVPASSPKGMGSLGIRNWECSSCGVVHDRDVNAAVNILKTGLSTQPLVEESRVSQLAGTQSP